MYCIFMLMHQEVAEAELYQEYYGKRLSVEAYDLRTIWRFITLIKLNDDNT